MRETLCKYQLVLPQLNDLVGSIEAREIIHLTIEKRVSISQLDYLLDEDVYPGEHLVTESAHVDKGIVLIQLGRIFCSKYCLVGHVKVE